MRNLLWGNALPADKGLNIAYLLFRFYAGLSLALGAGWPKMQQGMAPDWFVKQVAEIGFMYPSPAFWATVASWGEFVGGLFVAFGVLTRFSALQLAFQFFIVAFIWYKEPAPIVGMYYQQLLFWCFVLVAVAGSGRFSVDYLIQRGNLSRPGMRRVAIASALALLLAGSVATAVAMTKETPPPATANNLFESFTGTWEGTLTYTDYQSGKEVAIPARVVLTPVKGDVDAANVACSFPEEKGKEYTDVVRYTGKSKQDDRVLQWTAEESGYDEGKLATIRHHFYFSHTEIKVRKEVSFDGLSGFFTRNVYNLHRAK